MACCRIKEGGGLRTVLAAGAAGDVVGAVLVVGHQVGAGMRARTTPQEDSKAMTR